MRLLLACIVLFLAPAGALLLTDRSVSRIEEEFLTDASKQVQRLDDIYQLTPARIRRLRIAPAILQLRGLKNGSDVASRACALPDFYARLFDHLNARCGEWSVLRRARWSALAAVVLTFVMVGIVLFCRIQVQSHLAREQWPGAGMMWFLLRGVTVLLFAHVVISLAGYGILLKERTGKTALTWAILTLPCAGLVLVERKLVLAYVEPRSLTTLLPRFVPAQQVAATPAVAPSDNPAPPPEAAPTPEQVEAAPAAAPSDSPAPPPEAAPAPKVAPPEVRPKPQPKPVPEEPARGVLLRRRKM